MNVSLVCHMTRLTAGDKQGTHGVELLLASSSIPCVQQLAMCFSLPCAHGNIAAGTAPPRHVDLPVLVCACVNSARGSGPWTAMATSWMGRQQSPTGHSSAGPVCGSAIAARDCVAGNMSAVVNCCWRCCSRRAYGAYVAAAIAGMPYITHTDMHIDAIPTGASWHAQPEVPACMHGEEQCNVRALLVVWKAMEVAFETCPLCLRPCMSWTIAWHGPLATHSLRPWLACAAAMGATPKSPINGLAHATCLKPQPSNLLMLPHTSLHHQVHVDAVVRSALQPALLPCPTPAMPSSPPASRSTHHAW
jgi:hypothetical protein